jgi:hypothetical protein
MVVIQVEGTEGGRNRGLACTPTLSQLGRKYLHLVRKNVAIASLRTLSSVNVAKKNL